MQAVVGHAIRFEGRAFAAGDCTEAACLITRIGDMVEVIDPTGARPGHCRCECGEFGPHVKSNRERRQWHREHKIRLQEAAG